MNLITLSLILERKIQEGVEKLEKTDISTPTYDRLLTNIITSVTVLEKISYKPQPKPKEEKEN